MKHETEKTVAAAAGQPAASASSTTPELTPTEKAKGWVIGEVNGLKFKVLPYQNAVRALIGG